MKSIICWDAISILFILIGLAVSKYKCYWLISGYNTASKEEKSKIEIEKVAKHIGRMCYLIALVLFLGGIVTNYIEISIFPFTILIMIIIFGYLFYLQKYDHNKKSKAETILFIVIAFITLSVTIIVFSSGREANEIKINDKTIVIDGSFGTTIKREEIKNIELVYDLPEISLRINGYSDGSAIKKGDFKLKNGEKVKLYIQSKSGPYIKISTIKNEIYISYKDENQTLEKLSYLKQ